MSLFKHLSFALLLFFNTNHIQAQTYPQVEADYQKVLNEATTQESPSMHRGHGLANYYKALIAAGASEQYALNQTKIKFKQLKSTDLYAAFETLMKIPSAGMNPLRDELNSVEKEHVKALANWVIAGRNMSTYPAGVPKPHQKAVTQTNQTQNIAPKPTDDGAEELRLGNEAHKIKDYKTAYDLYIKSAEKGNMSGIANLGLMHEFGQHVEKNLDKAMEYYSKAVDMGSKFAMHRKAFVMANNIKYRNDKESFDLFMKAQDVNVEAQSWLGYLYEQGRGVDFSYEKAMEWYKKAADAGNDYSKKKLESLPKEIASGTAYNTAAFNTKGTKSIKLYELAYAKGNSFAPYKIGQIYLKGEGEVTIDTIKGIEWTKKASDMDYLEGHITLAVVYYKQKKYPEAFEYRMKAAKTGHSSSMNSIGYMYHNGQGVVKDFNEAFKWYAAAADKGLGMAMHNVAVMYTYGEGTPKNLLAAKSWHEKAIAAGYKDSEEKLKEVEKMINSSSTNTTTTTPQPITTLPDNTINDINREGVTLYNQKKYVEALPHLEKAASLGDAEALYRLGMMYDFGYGVTANEDKAINYYSSAEKLGHKKASDMLDEIYYWGW
jgi:TPR repeat protein